MSAAAIFLAAALTAGFPANLPMYPGGKATRVAGSLVITSADPLGKVKAGYTAVFRKAGWKPSVPDSVLNGDVPGASKADIEALSRAITYLSFERRGETVDLFLAPGRDRHRRLITVITILGVGTEADPTRTKLPKSVSHEGTAGANLPSRGGVPAAPKPPPEAVLHKGDRHGRP